MYLLYKDDPGQYNNMAKTGNSTNGGFIKRSNLVTGGRTVCTSARLLFDFAERGKLLPPNSDFSLTFQHNPDSFRIMCSEEKEMKVVFEEISLRVTKSYLEPEIFNQLMTVLNSVPAVYNFHRHDKFEQNIPIGARNFHEKMFSERVPETVMVFFVYTDALLGKYDKNPLEFPDLDVSKVSNLSLTLLLSLDVA